MTERKFIYLHRESKVKIRKCLVRSTVSDILAKLVNTIILDVTTSETRTDIVSEKMTMKRPKLQHKGRRNLLS